MNLRRFLLGLMIPVMFCGCGRLTGTDDAAVSDTAASPADTGSGPEPSITPTPTTTLFPVRTATFDDLMSPTGPDTPTTSFVFDRELSAQQVCSKLRAWSELQDHDYVGCGTVNPSTYWVVYHHRNQSHLGLWTTSLLDGSLSLHARSFSTRGWSAIWVGEKSDNRVVVVRDADGVRYRTVIDLEVVT